jgi:hypothetical protein
MSVFKVVTDSFGRIIGITEEAGCGCGCLLAGLFGVALIPIALLAIISRLAGVLFDSFGQLSWPSLGIWTVSIAGTPMPAGAASDNGMPAASSSAGIPWVDFAPLGISLVLAAAVLIVYFVITRRWQ